VFHDVPKRERALLKTLRWPFSAWEMSACAERLEVLSEGLHARIADKGAD